MIRTLLHRMPYESADAAEVALLHKICQVQAEIAQNLRDQASLWVFNAPMRGSSTQQKCSGRPQERNNLEGRNFESETRATNNTESVGSFIVSPARFQYRNLYGLTSEGLPVVPVPSNPNLQHD